MTRVRVEGLKDLDRALGEFPKRTGKSVLGRALTKAGKPLAQAAQNMAPVETGELRDSIIVSARLSRGQKRLIRGSRKSTAERYVGPRSGAKSIAQEFGTFAHPAQPFLRPAWDARRRQVLEVFKVELGKAIIKAAKRIALKSAKG